MKRKHLIALGLAIVVVIGLVTSAFVLLYKPKAKINDLTSEDAQDKSSSFSMDNNECSAVISPTVNVYEGEEASQINSSIKSVTASNEGIVVKTTKNKTALSDLGTNDIFFLEGSQDTAFEQTFIGKIESKNEQDNEITYIIGTPTFDEVFDVLQFDHSEVLTNDKISEIETVEGVVVTQKDSLKDDFGNAQTQTVSSNSNPEVSYLSYNPDQKPLASPTIDKSLNLENDSLIFDFNIDLLDTFGFETKSNSEFKDVYTLQESNRIKVYRTDTGFCYHRDNCPCVSKSKFEMTLTEANLEGFDPCYLCNPPVTQTDPGVFTFDASLDLTGKVGIESIDFGACLNWDIENGDGLEDLSTYVNGNFVGEASIKAGFKCELGGRTTTITLPFGVGHFQGLDEKLFPLAFIGYNAYLTPVSAESNDGIRLATSSVPLTIGIIVYVDAYGSLSLSSSIEMNCNYNFTYTNDIVTNGNVRFDQNLNDDFNAEFKLITELKGDADAHFGISGMVYIFNLNVLEVAIARIGAEAEGMLKLQYSKDLVNGDSESSFDSDFYMRIYYKLFSINLRMRCKINTLLGLIDVSAEAKYDYTAKDETLKEWGIKGTTQFVDSKMSYTSVTAKDSKSLYYIDTNGQLIKETGKYREPLYTEPFFIICGIDETYIYLLSVSSEGDGYDVYRVHKNRGTSKRIISSLANFLMFDKSNIYYSSTFDKTVVTKFNREDLSEKYFIDSSDEIVLMTKQYDGNYYLVTQSTNFFDRLFGGGNRCRLYNASGEELKDYGENVDVKNYLFQKQNNSYYSAARMTSGGFLRSTAAEIYWSSLGRDNYVRAESVSGWNYTSKGILVTQNIPVEELPPEKVDENNNPIPIPKFRMVIYGASNGSTINVQDVFSNQAMFTLCQSKNGRWYYFDQTDKELILYSLSENFSQKEIEKVFPREELPCNLSECSMTNVDNTLYFYTIKDNKYSQVLYRYNIT